MILFGGRSPENREQVHVNLSVVRRAFGAIRNQLMSKKAHPVMAIPRRPARTASEPAGTELDFQNGCFVCTAVFVAMDCAPCCPCQ
jgi:hypothetical protein